ncbi:MAG: hypothetical protein U1E76_15145 [Planctomycetota bacterium]
MGGRHGAVDRAVATRRASPLAGEEQGVVDGLGELRARAAAVHATLVGEKEADRRTTHVTVEPGKTATARIAFE